MRFARFARTVRVPVINIQWFAAALVLGSALFVPSSTAVAASINYGDFGPVAPGVTFLDVTESSGTDPVPLYGPPTPFVTGLDFDPKGFVAYSIGGGGDFTDGQLNFTLMNAAGITDISISESGDYELSGFGAANASVGATAFLSATVTQVNGVNVAPFDLTPVFASFSDSLPGSVAAPWSLGVLMDVAAQLGPNSRATKIEVVIDNRLRAASEAGSGAFIAKKQFVIGVGIIPEPASFALAGIALCGIMAAARRRG